MPILLEGMATLEVGLSGRTPQAPPPKRQHLPSPELAALQHVLSWACGLAALGESQAQNSPGQSPNHGPGRAAALPPPLHPWP